MNCKWPSKRLTGRSTRRARSSRLGARAGTELQQFQTEVEAAETARAAVLATLDATQAELASLKATTCPRADLDALQHKFGVTLSEVQKLKRENEELNRRYIGHASGPKRAVARTDRRSPGA